MTKNLVYTALVALAVSIVVGLVMSPSPSNLGGLSERVIQAISLDVNGAALVNTFTQGGGIRATSTSGTAVPLVASDFDVENVIDVTLNVANATLSFPSTTTLKGFIPNAGDSRKLYVRNATTTAAKQLTLSGGTGVLMKFASSTPAVTGLISGDTDGANFAIIELVRKANTDIEALVSFFKD